MKKTLLIWTILGTLGTMQVQSQDKGKQEIFNQEARVESQKMAGLGYKFLKSIFLDFSKSTENELSYVFTRGVNYLIKVNDCDVMVSILDANKKIIFSNYVRQENKCVNALQLQCQRTGVYYIRFSLKSRNTDLQKPFLSVIGFKKQASLHLSTQKPILQENEKILSKM